MTNFSALLGTGSTTNCDKPNAPRYVVDPSFPTAVIVRSLFSGRTCPAYAIVRTIDLCPDVVSATEAFGCEVCANADVENVGHQAFPLGDSWLTIFGGTGWGGLPLPDVAPLIMLVMIAGAEIPITIACELARDPHFY